MNFRRGFRLQLRNLWELPSAGSASTALISQSSGAANAALKTQESTLLRAATRHLQVVNGEKSRTDYLPLDMPTYSPGVRSTANQLTQIESRAATSGQTLVMVLAETSPRMIQSAASMHTSKESGGLTVGRSCM